MRVEKDQKNRTHIDLNHIRVEDCTGSLCQNHISLRMLSNVVLNSAYVLWFTSRMLGIPEFWYLVRFGCDGFFQTILNFLSLKFFKK